MRWIMSSRRCCGSCVVWKGMYMNDSGGHFELSDYDQIAGVWQRNYSPSGDALYTSDADAIALNRTPGVFGEYGCTLHFSSMYVSGNSYTPYLTTAHIIFAAEDEDNYFYLTFSETSGSDCIYYMTFYLYRRIDGTDTLIDSKQVCVQNQTYTGQSWNGPSALTWWEGGVRFQHGTSDNYGGRIYYYDGDMGSGMKWGLGTSNTNSSNVGWGWVYCSKAKDLCSSGTCDSNYCLPSNCEAVRADAPARDLILPDEFSVAIAGNVNGWGTGCSQLDGTYVLSRGASLITNAAPGDSFWNYTLPTPITIQYSGTSNPTVTITAVELCVGVSGIFYSMRAQVYFIGTYYPNGTLSTAAALGWGKNYAETLDNIIANWSAESFPHFATGISYICNAWSNASTCHVTAL